MLFDGQVGECGEDRTRFGERWLVTVEQTSIKAETSDTSQNRVRVLTEVEKAWLAGVIDGEGSILISKISPKHGHYRRGFYYRANLEVANSNEAFLRKVTAVIGKGSISLTEEKNHLWKDKWQYGGSSRVLIGLLPQILPYLIVKADVAERMIEYLRFVDANPIDGTMQVPPGFDEKRDRLYLAVKRLNEKGLSRNGLLSHQLRLDDFRRRGRGIRASNCKQLNETGKAWLAGVIDGEGTLSISKMAGHEYRRGFFYCPKLEVSNTNWTFLKKIEQTIGEGGVYTSKKETEVRKKRWAYMATAGVLRVILPQILTYLIIKKAQARKLMEFFQYIDGNPIYGRKEVPVGYYEPLDAIYGELKRLNKKGKEPDELK